MIKLFLKGVLLYITAFSIILLFCGIDSIVEEGCLLQWVVVSFILIYVCKKYISKRDFIKLTFSKKEKDTRI